MCASLLWLATFFAQARRFRIGAFLDLEGVRAAMKFVSMVRARGSESVAKLVT